MQRLGTTKHWIRKASGTKSEDEDENEQEDDYKKAPEFFQIPAHPTLNKTTTKVQLVENL